MVSSRIPSNYRNMLVEVEEEMKIIKKNLEDAWDRQKIYADQHKAFKEFQVREHVYL